MAYAKVLFNTETLAILNMVNPGETLSYDWSLDEDYSIVLCQGSIQMPDQTILTGVTEHRVQPDTNLSVIGMGSVASYYISLFRIDNDHIADQIVTQENKKIMKTVIPTWYDNGLGLTQVSTWESEFTEGDFILSQHLLNIQVGLSEGE
tara:strand:- start:2325 stop:2771 length:447 start_codon:yes stop_codon:yes gene_type:complete